MLQSLRDGLSTFFSDIPQIIPTTNEMWPRTGSDNTGGDGHRDDGRATKASRD